MWKRFSAWAAAFERDTGVDVKLLVALGLLGLFVRPISATASNVLFIVAATLFYGAHLYRQGVTKPIRLLRDRLDAVEKNTAILRDDIRVHERRRERSRAKPDGSGRIEEDISASASQQAFTRLVRRMEVPLRRICGFQFSFGSETLVDVLKLTSQETDHARAHGTRLLEVSLEDWRDHSVINVVEVPFGHDVLAELGGGASSSRRCSQRRLDLYADIIKIPLILWELPFGGDERLILYLQDGALHLTANGGRFGGSRADWLRVPPPLSQMPIVDYPLWPPPLWSEPQYRFLKASFPEPAGDQLFEFLRQKPANDFLEDTELRLASGFASRQYADRGRGIGWNVWVYDFEWLRDFSDRDDREEAAINAFVEAVHAGDEHLANGAGDRLVQAQQHRWWFGGSEVASGRLLLTSDLDARTDSDRADVERILTSTNDILLSFWAVWKLQHTDGRDAFLASVSDNLDGDSEPSVWSRRKYVGATPTPESAIGLLKGTGFFDLEDFRTRGQGRA